MCHFSCHYDLVLCGGMLKCSNSKQERWKSVDGGAIHPGEQFILVPVLGRPV